MAPPAHAASPSTPAVARFVVASQPAPRVVYGTQSKVVAALITGVGVGVPAQEVRLMAKVRPSTKWRGVASGRTDITGRVTLRATLPASAALRLRHPDSLIAAPDVDVRSVVVAKRITVSAGPTRTRLGKQVVIRGGVEPTQPIGSLVVLQQRAGGSWKRITSGRMITKNRYAIRWDPQRARTYVLRVRRRGDPLRAAGTSAAWRHRVDPETAAALARDILRNKRITLEKVHASGGSYLGSPHQNIIDVANGRPARHSCHGGAPCATSKIDLRVLSAVRDMGTRATVTVSEFVGGVHKSGSPHFFGRAVDINWVGGRHIGQGADYDMVVERCRAFGAIQIFTPSNDPDGAHHNHIHCAWR